MCLGAHPPCPASSQLGARVWMCVSPPSCMPTGRGEAGEEEVQDSGLDACMGPWIGGVSTFPRCVPFCVACFARYYLHAFYKSGIAPFHCCIDPFM